MRILKQVFLLATIASAGASAVLSKRADAATIDTDLQTLRAQAFHLNDTITAFKGDIATAIPVYEAYRAVHRTTKTTLDDVKSAAASFNDGDSQGVSTYYFALEDVTFGIVDNLIRQKPLFDRVPTAHSAVKSALESERSLLKELGDQIQTRLSPTFKIFFPYIVQTVVNKLDEGVQAYS